MYFHLQDWFPVILSLRVAALVVLIVAVLGLPVSRFMARYDFPGKDVCEAFITLPLVLPPSVIGYGLLLLIGKNGFIGKYLAGLGINLIFTWHAIIMAAAVVAFPLFYQTAKAAFNSVDLNYEKAARTLGASELRVFFTITLPLAWPGVTAGLVLAFARALGEFGATLMVAGNIPGQTQTIPVAIYYAVDRGDEATARTLVLIITLFSFAVIWGINHWRKNVERTGE